MSVGQTIAGRYEVFRTLGRGGMGEVHAAYDLQLERKVALKAIRSEFRLDPASRARFLREARALSKLEHGSICRIHDYVEGEDQDYLVLELIEGEPLRDRLIDGLDKADAFRFAEQIGDALSVAHAEGLVHRDLKPGNVMITPDGNAKILDFGLARSAVEGLDRTATVTGEDPDGTPPSPGTKTLTTDGTADDTLERTMTAFDPDSTPASSDSVTVIGTAVGTPLYMSPEQARGEEVGAASDMFSFGLLLHEMFTGTRAYAADDREQLTELVRDGRTSLVRGLDRHLTDLIERLKSAASSRRPTAIDATVRLRWVRDKPKRRLRWSVATVAIVVAVSAGIKYTLDLRRERAAADFRRSQSDQHIEFMVEELYTKLEPVGRLDILEDVGVKALEYFETLGEGETTSEDRARLGRTWTQIGNVRQAAGDYDAAKEAFAASLAIHQELVQLAPLRGEWWMGLSAAHFGVAGIAWVEDDLARATEHFDAYMDVSRSLVELDPDDPTYQLELGYALTNMAALHEALGEPALARDELLQAVTVKRRLAVAEPDNREYAVSLANTLGWLAGVARDMGDLEPALDAATDALVLRRGIAADERDADAQQHLSISLQQAGILLSANGFSAEAEEAFREDISISTRLARLDPDNMEWQSGLATSWNSLGRFYVELDRFEEAGPLLENSVRELKRLMTVEPEQGDWRVEFCKARHSLAMLEHRQGRPREALRILADGAPSIRPWQRLLDLLVEAEAYLAVRDPGRARKALREIRPELLEAGQPKDVSRYERLKSETGA